GLVSGPAGGEGDPAAAGNVRVADPLGVADHRAHVLRPDAQRLSQLHGDGSARPADIGRALNQADGAVAVDAGRGARLQAAVEPEARGDATAAVGAGKWGLVMGMGP